MEGKKKREEISSYFFFFSSFHDLSIPNRNLFLESTSGTVWRERKFTCDRNFVSFYSRQGDSSSFGNKNNNNNGWKREGLNVKSEICKSFDVEKVRI